MTTMTMTVTQQWTDGISLIQLEGRVVRVQVGGALWISRYDDDEEAQIAYASEIATAMDGRCYYGDEPGIEDDHEWIRRGC